MEFHVGIIQRLHQVYMRLIQESYRDYTGLYAAHAKIIHD